MIVKPNNKFYFCNVKTNIRQQFDQITKEYTKNRQIHKNLKKLKNCESIIFKTPENVSSVDFIKMFNKSEICNFNLNPYAEMLIKKYECSNLLYFRPEYILQIFKGEFNFKIFRKQNLDNYDGFVAFMLKTNHWTFMFFDAKRKVLMWLDPAFPDRELEESSKFAKNLKKYFKKRNKVLNVKEKWGELEEITPVTVSHPMQEDNFNCGICCLKFLEEVLSSIKSNEQPDFEKLDFKKEALAEKRLRIARELEMSGVGKGEFCSRCGDNSDHLIICSNYACNRAHCLQCPLLVDGLCSVCACLNLDVIGLSDSQVMLFRKILKIKSSVKLTKEDLNQAFGRKDFRLELIKMLCDKAGINADLNFLRKRMRENEEKFIRKIKMLKSKRKRKSTEVKTNSSKKIKDTNKKEGFKNKNLTRRENETKGKLKRFVKPHESQRKISKKHSIEPNENTNKVDKLRHGVNENQLKRKLVRSVVVIPKKTKLSSTEIKRKVKLSSIDTLPTFQNKFSDLAVTTKHVLHKSRKVEQTASKSKAGVENKTNCKRKVVEEPVITISEDKCAPTTYNKEKTFERRKETPSCHQEIQTQPEVNKLLPTADNATQMAPRKRKSSDSRVQQQKNLKLENAAPTTPKKKPLVLKEKEHKRESCSVTTVQPNKVKLVSLKKKPTTSTSFPVKKSIKVNNSPCKLDEAQLVEPKKLKNSNPAVPHNKIKFYVKHEESQTKLNSTTKTSDDTKKLPQNQNNFDSFPQKNEIHENNADEDNEVPKTNKKRRNTPREQQSTTIPKKEPLMKRRIENFFEYETFNVRTRRQLVYNFIVKVFFRTNDIIFKKKIY